MIDQWEWGMRAGHVDVKVDIDTPRDRRCRNPKTPAFEKLAEPIFAAAIATWPDLTTKVSGKPWSKAWTCEAQAEGIAARVHVTIAEHPERTDVDFERVFQGVCAPLLAAALQAGVAA